MPEQNPIILSNLDRVIGLMMTLFFNPKDFVALQEFKSWVKKPHWGYRPVKVQNDLDEIIKRHLRGLKTYGFYSHSISETCLWLCIDIDLKIGLLKDRKESVAFVLGMVIQCLKDLGIPEEAMLFEFSGNKGFHVWVMLQESPMAECQNFIRHFKNSIGPMPYDAGLTKETVHLDQFPHPSTDPENCQYGLPVKLPCALHNTSGKFSHFIDINKNPVENVPALLESVVPCQLPDLPLISAAKKPKNKRPPKILSASAQRKKANAPIMGDPLEQPPLTAELNALFSGCHFLKGFRERPFEAGYREWTHAGQLLVGLGEEGTAWFEYLSSLDQRRYDGSHVGLIEKITSGELERSPRCQTIECPHCDRGHAYEILDEYRQRYQITHSPEPLPPAEEVDLADLKDQLETALLPFFQDDHERIALVNMPVGGFKTQTALELVQRYNRPCVYFCPNHHLAKDIAERFQSKALIIMGHERLQEETDFHCPYAEEIAEARSLGRSSGEFCNAKHGKCTKRSQCEYLKQFEKASRAKMVILVHDHLQLGHDKRKMVFKGKKIVILDESFHRQYRMACDITQEELKTLREVLVEEGHDAVVDNMVDPLLRFIRGGNRSLVLPSVDLPLKAFTEIDQRYMEDYPEIKNPLRDLLRAGELGLKATMPVSGSIHLNLPATLPGKMPILILDATASAEDYERLLGRPIETINPAAGLRLKQFGHVTQVVTGSYPNSSIFVMGPDNKPTNELTETGRRIIDFALSQIRDWNDFGIISTQAVEQYLLEQRGIPEERLMHFNLLRGLNDFRNVQDLVIIGYQGINHKDMAHDARILFDQDWDDEEKEIELKTQKAWRPIESEGSRQCQVKFLSPKDPHIRSFHNLCVLGEVEQAVGRARLFTPSNKKDRRIVLITNAPTSIRVNELVTLDLRENPIKEAAQRLLQEHGEFTVKKIHEEVQKETPINEKTLRKHLKTLMVDLDLVETTRASNLSVYSYRSVANATAPGEEVDGEAA